MTEENFYSLFGKLIDDEDVVNYFNSEASFKIGKPRDGRVDVKSNDLGIDFAFIPDSGPSGGKTKHLRKCQVIFLYSAGYDRHKTYTGYVPYGFKLTDTRKQILEKSTPSKTWILGTGIVEITHPSPDRDKWELDDYSISVNYKKDLSIKFIVLQRKVV